MSLQKNHGTCLSKSFRRARFRWQLTAASRGRSFRNSFTEAYSASIYACAPFSSWPVVGTAQIGPYLSVQMVSQTGEFALPLSVINWTRQL